MSKKRHCFKCDRRRCICIVDKAAMMVVVTIIIFLVLAFFWGVYKNFLMGG